MILQYVCIIECHLLLTIHHSKKKTCSLDFLWYHANGWASGPGGNLSVTSLQYFSDSFQGEDNEISKCICS